VGLGADLWIRVIFGSAFAPAGLPLRLLAAMFVLTYVAIVSATCLNVIGRGWFVTAISTAGLVVNPFLNVALVRFARGHLGVPGAAGSGAALSMLVAELFIAATMTTVLGGMAFDRRSVSAIGRMVFAAAAAVALDFVARPLGWARLALDMALYLALVFALRAVHWREVVDFTRAALRHREAPPASEPAA
jgi:O-antigen/teichoic acid export membrane protein